MTLSPEGFFTISCYKKIIFIRLGLLVSLLIVVTSYPAKATWGRKIYWLIIWGCSSNGRSGMVAGAWGGWWQGSRRWMLVFSLLPSFMKTRITACGVASFARRPGLPCSAKSPWKHLPSTPGGVSTVVMNFNSIQLTVRINSHDYLWRVLCTCTGILGIRARHMNKGQIPCSPQNICKNRLPGRMPLFSFLLWTNPFLFSLVLLQNSLPVTSFVTCSLPSALHNFPDIVCLKKELYGHFRGVGEGSRNKSRCLICKFT